jgi:peroxiredoxin (alkyl hydroperoxide reductase subunit C)
VLSISVDSVYVHKVWNDLEMKKMQTTGVEFPMLSDTGGNIGRLYGVYDDNALVDQRGSFIIDPSGIIQGIEVLSSGVGRSVDETLRQIAACQVLRESDGESLTPANWIPGACTLSPSPDLVGNVWKTWKPVVIPDYPFIENPHSC